MSDLRPRVGVENRLPEFIEEAIHMDPIPADLLAVVAAELASLVSGTLGRPIFPLHAPATNAIA